jgi:hypothetical protein
MASWYFLPYSGVCWSISQVTEWLPTRARVCLHLIGYPEAGTGSPRLAQKAWKVPWSLAIRNAKTLRKPGCFQRMPARLNRL